jgi:cellulose synthase/poly-beta-1,6-N-acetylglucosamine synthase-like glycosyltransferase
MGSVKNGVFPVLVVQLITILPLVALNVALAAEMFAGLLRPASWPKASSEGRCALIVPAHNEAAIIQSSLTGIIREMPPYMHALVIADNCSDSTADIARACKVEVIERTDRALLGKGHALAFARDHLKHAPPSIVIIVDADCEINRDSLIQLNDVATATGHPVQAVNLLRPNRLAHPLVQVSTFAFLLKNLVRQRGLQRLSGGVHLNGTGMAIPWKLFARADLATSNIVEDLALGLEFSASGQAPLLHSEAAIWSPSSDPRGTIAQRTRWEGGFIATTRKFAFPLLGSAIARADLRRMWLGINLLIPPLALLGLFNVMAGLANIGLLFLGGTLGPLLILFCSIGLALSGVAASWYLLGRDFLTLRALMVLPAYMMWKIPLYLRLAAGRPLTWLRSGR